MDSPGCLFGDARGELKTPGTAAWGAAPLLLRFCLPSPAAASSSSPPPRRACPQRCPRALTEEGAGDGVPVLMLLLEVPELLGLLAHVDGQPGPHHPMDRAASERSARRIARGTQPAAFSPHCPQEQLSRLRNSPRSNVEGALRVPKRVPETGIRQWSLYRKVTPLNNHQRQRKGARHRQHLRGWGCTPPTHQISPPLPPRGKSFPMLLTHMDFHPPNCPWSSYPAGQAGQLH